eukprot:11749366-Alexandrium_andersonii.AAC.1
MSGPGRWRQEAKLDDAGQPRTNAAHEASDLATHAIHASAQSCHLRKLRNSGVARRFCAMCADCADHIHVRAWRFVPFHR